MYFHQIHQSFDRILGLQFLDMLQREMYLLTECVLLQSCFFDEFADDGVGLDQFADLHLEVDVWGVPAGELEFWEFELGWADLRFLFLWVGHRYSC